MIKEEVVSVDLEAVSGWQILSFEDYGRSTRISYKAYPHNELRQEKFWFKRGYKRLRNHVLPTGGAISKVNRKAYLDCILQDLHMHYLRSA